MPRKSRNTILSKRGADRGLRCSSERLADGDQREGSERQMQKRDFSDPAQRDKALGLLESVHYSIQRLRCGVGHRLDAIQRNADVVNARTLGLLEDEHQKLLASEKAFLKDIEDCLLVHYPIWTEWLQHVKGLGPTFAARLLSMLFPPKAGIGPSVWYKAAGLAPELQPDGQRRLPRYRAVRCPRCAGKSFRRKSGEKVCVACGHVLPPGAGGVTFYPRLRALLWLIGQSFVMRGGYYRQVYERAKAQIAEKHAGDKDWPPARVDKTARIKAVKLFLSHLWEVWCELEGIPPRVPYCIEYLGHSNIIPAPRWSGNGKI